MTQLAHFIKRRREALGLSQSDVANACGITPQAVSNWECGGSVHIRPQHLLALAGILQVGVEELIKGSEKSVESLLPEEKALLIAFRQLQTDEKKVLQKIVRGLLKN